MNTTAPVEIVENNPTIKGRNRYQILSRGLKAKRGVMNKTEAEWAAVLTQDPDVAQWWFEPLTLRLSHPREGQPARLTPDFMILLQSGITIFDDVKGTGLDDPASAVRMKAAAELFGLWKFRIVKKRTKSQGGGYDVREL